MNSTPASLVVSAFVILRLLREKRTDGREGRGLGRSSVEKLCGEWQAGSHKRGTGRKRGILSFSSVVPLMMSELLNRIPSLLT